MAAKTDQAEVQGYIDEFVKEAVSVKESLDKPEIPASLYEDAYKKVLRKFVANVRSFAERKVGSNAKAPNESPGKS
jgi:hypothetical protein